MKTVGSLCIGDKVYIANLTAIHEYPVKSLEKMSGSVIAVKCESWTADSDTEPAKGRYHPKTSQTTYVGRGGDTVCVNYDKAIRVQYEMRLKEFNARVAKIREITGSLEAMMMGWFQPADPEKSNEPTMEE